jgi:hypothetical protein
MDTLLQATEAAIDLAEKLDKGIKVTAEEYANVLNPHNEVVNEANNPVVQITAALFITSTWEHAEHTGYKVTYDKQDDTFSVTGGTNG